MDYWKKLKLVGTVIFVIILVLASIASLSADGEEEVVDQKPMTSTSKFNF